MNEVIKLRELIYYLPGSHSSNIYYLNYNKKALIDCGHIDDLSKNIEAFYNADIDLTQIDYILLTHSHGDHLGLLSYLKNKNPQIKIFASRFMKDFIKYRKNNEMFKTMEDDFPDFDIDVELDDNEYIDFGNEKVKTIICKGHTRDSVSYFIEKDKILFTGDTLYKRVIVQLDYYQNLNKSLLELENTYKKLMNLSIDLFYTGHGNPITEPADNLGFCMKKLNRFKTDAEMMLVNNMFPFAEFVLNKYKSLTSIELYNLILKGMLDFKSEPSFSDYTPYQMEKVTTRIIGLLKMLKIITEINGKVSLTNGINGYIM